MTDQLEPVQANLHHELIPPRIGAARYPTLVLLHGRGDCAAGIAPLAFEFERDDLLVLSVQAPLELGGVMAGGYEWYRLRQPRHLDEATLRDSLAALAEFLDMVTAAYPVDPERIVLLGFSQGAAWRWARRLLRPDSVAGVIALSSYFPIEVEPEAGNWWDAQPSWPTVPTTTLLRRGRSTHERPSETPRRGPDLPRIPDGPPGQRRGDGGRSGLVEPSRRFGKRIVNVHGGWESRLSVVSPGRGTWLEAVGSGRGWAPTSA